MKIGYLRLDHGEWAQGAYNSQEIGLAKAFVKMGHDVTIFYCVYPDDPKCGTTVEIQKKIKKSYLPAKAFGHHALLNIRELDKYPLDLLHIQGDNLLKVPEAVSYCKKRGLPYYCYVGRIDSEKREKLHRFLARIMVQRNIRTYRNNPVFVKTPAVKAELEAYGAKNVKVAPVGLDLSIIPQLEKSVEELKKKLQLPLDKKIILCVCALREGKRPYDIFQLVNLLESDIFFVYIGGWNEKEEEKFRERIEKEGLKGRFRYINKLPNTEIHEYYKASDFFVNFNPNEIFGMAILEAMYQGGTVIARKAPGPEYIIENGKSGYVVDSVEKMAQIIKDGRNTGNEAHKRIIKDFIWEKTAQIFLGEEK